MLLTPGSRLGPYEIVAPLGAGGMGEVYKARDTRLDRAVAIKILPADVAADPQRRERLRREARAISSLTHAHICTLHDIGAQDGIEFLVMEYLAGETLAHRLLRGALPLEEVLRIAVQLADALEAAHRTGLTHRDLKPANVMLTHGGAKVLDFGLAKWHGGHPDVVSSVAHVTAHPTVTQAGIVVGTIQYMAPEQVEGKTADSRSDLFSLGAIVYEMTTGQRAFAGTSSASVMAAILSSAPAPMTIAQPVTPPALERVVTKCLAKDPSRRWQTASDLRDALAWVAEDLEAPATAPAPILRRSSWMLMALSVAGTLIVGVVVDRALTKPPDSRVLTHLSMSVAPVDQLGPSAQGSFRPSRTAFALSPDGRTMVFSGGPVKFGAIRTPGTATRLFIRALDQAIAAPVAGTEGGSSPFFSPDGKWIAFWANGKLKKTPATGGAPIDICDMPEGSDLFGASWGSNDTIAFSVRSRIMTVPAAGGTPQEVVKAQGAGDSGAVVLPHWLPGEHTLLYTTCPLDDWTQARIVARSPEGGEPHTLIEGGADARYVPTGHLLYMKFGTLVAVPFDAERLRITGAPVTLIDDVMQAVNAPNGDDETGAGQFVVAAAGTLAYVRGGIFPDFAALAVWVDRRGTETPLKEPPGPLRFMRLSPDGRRLAYMKSRTGSSAADIWVYDLERHAATRLTLAGSWNFPLSAPDGQHVIFTSEADGDLYWMPTDSSESPERVATSANEKQASSASTNGLVAFLDGPAIWTLSLKGDRTPRLFLKSPFSVIYPALSADGRWLAYASNESGRYEVYVQAYPGPGGKHRISLDGGGGPMWARSGRELFYWNRVKPGVANFTMMAVDVDTTQGFKAGAPHALFSGEYGSTTTVTNSDVSADGQRFIVTKLLDNGEKPATPIEISLNWTDELQRRAPVAKK